MQVSSATPTPTPTPNPKPKPAPTPIPPAPVDEDIFIDNKLWYSLKLYVFDAEKGNHLQHAVIDMYEDEIPCKETNPINVKKIRSKQTEKNGESEINNLLID